MFRDLETERLFLKSISYEDDAFFYREPLIIKLFIALAFVALLYHFSGGFSLCLRRIFRGPHMKLIRCEENDFEKIADFYKYVIEHTQHMEKYGRWVYGQHPTDNMIRQYIDGGYMFYLENDSSIIAAVALTPFQENDYHPVNWRANLKDDEVCVVHILCVNPDLQRSGVAKAVMKEVIDFAKDMGKKAVRLDALCCNEPAHKLYEKIGFVKCGEQNWYAVNTGWIDFYLYEFVVV